MFLDKMSEDEKRVFLELQKNGPLNKKALLGRVDMKPSKLNRVIISLLESGAVQETRQETSAIGRKPSLFDVNTGEKYLIGIDINRTGITAVLCDIKMNVLERLHDEIGFDFEYSHPDTLLPNFCEKIRCMMDWRGLGPEQILGVGAAMVGPIDTHSGKIGTVHTFPTDGWSGMNLKTRLEELLGLPVYVDCGTCAGVLFEYLYGAGRGRRSVAYFNIGIGIRSSYISSGSIIRAAGNDETAFSHTSLSPLGERCDCGKNGCICRYSSSRSIYEKVRKRIELGERSMIKKDIKDIYYKEIAEAARKGDELSINAIRAAGEHLGHALSNYITLLNPQLVIIAGTAVYMSDVFYDAVVGIASWNIRCSGSETEFFRGSTHRGETISVGAAAMYFEKYMGNKIMD